MLLDVFSPIIEPSKGFFSVEIPDDAVVLNVRYAIWNQYQDYLRKTTVNIALHDIQLRYLVLTFWPALDEYLLTIHHNS